MLYARIRVVIITTLLCYSSISQAQMPMDKPAAMSSQLSLRDAIAATRMHAPELLGFQFRQEALKGELQTAGLRPALQVEATLENIAGNGEYQALNSAELTLALSSVIELGGKREARLGVVSERQQQLAVEQRIIELDLLAEVTRRFIDVAAAEKQLDLWRKTLGLTTETTRSIKRRVNAGSLPEAELARAQANQTRMNVSLRQAQLRFDASKIQLSVLWGSMEPEFTSVSADLLSPAKSRPLDTLLANLSNNPDIQLIANEERLRDAEVRLALSQRHADVEWNAGVRQMQASKDSAVVVGVNVPLFSAKRGTGQVSTAKANRQLVEVERDTARLKLRAQLIGLYREQEASLYEVESLRDEVIPQLKKAVKEISIAFDKGRYSYLELSSSQQDLLEAEYALITAAANTHVLRVEIERLCDAAATKDSEVNL